MTHPHTTTDRDPIRRLRDSLNGRVIEPDDSVYDQARTVFSGRIDRRPLAIARVADADDVARVVSTAADTGLELAVRSGGHSAAGHSTTDGGIVLDLRDMKTLDIDVESRTAWAQAGLTAGEYTVAAGHHGLATGFGDSGSVGIGGITLAGGLGFLVRKHGLTIDHLIAAEMVTADGRLLRVDQDTRPDLFWAVRGGGGNFGVVTRFQYRLHPVRTIVGGVLILPATPEVISGFLAEAEAAPEELTTIANVMPAPPIPMIPEEHHGQLVIMAMLTYAGPADAGQRVIAPIKALATPIADAVRTMTYPEMYEPNDEDYHPRSAVRTQFIDHLDHAQVEEIVDRLKTSTALMPVAQLRVLGGAMAAVPADATAFAHRQRKLMVNFAAVYQDVHETEIHERWAIEAAAALGGGPAGAYVGLMGDEGYDRIVDAYPGPTLDRLADVKSRYDPTNLFRLNQNIEPAEDSAVA